MEPTLEQELEQLVKRINKRTGITNSFDYNRSVEMFERLLDRQVPFEPEEVRSWLVTRGGLLPEDARAVMHMAQKFRTGTRVRRR